MNRKELGSGVALIAALGIVSAACTGYIPPRGELGGVAALYQSEVEELPPLSPEDSVAVRRRVRDKLRLHYSIVRGGYFDLGSGACLAEQGDFCFRGDWDTTMCTIGSRAFCSTDEEEFEARRELLAVLDSAAAVLPGDGFVVGQQVYARGKFRHWGPAFRALDRCRAEAWWCESMRGWLLYRAEAFDEAEAVFLDVLRILPAEIRCEWTSLELVIRSKLDDSYRNLSCEERGPINDRVWWLADPLYLVPGNERWTEQIMRFVTVELHRDLLDARESYHPPAHHRVVIPKGFKDSWDLDRINISSSARYAFIPEWDAVEAPTEALPEHWDLQDRSLDKAEGYTPPHGFFYTDLDYQIGFFRRGDSAQVVIVSEVGRNERLAPWEYGAGVYLARSETDTPVTEFVRDKQDHYTFQKTVSAEPYLISVEAIAYDHGAGRARFGQGPPFSLDESVGISDLLMYEPFGWEPRSLNEVVERGAYGRTEYTPADDLGLFWEIYGAEENEPVSLIFTAERQGGGFLGVWGGSDPIRIEWTDVAEPDEDGIWATALDLDMTGFEAGDYLFEIRASVGGMIPVAVQRWVRVVER